MNRKETLISSSGAFVGMLLATYFSSLILSLEGASIILASTGASAMLIFGLPYSPVSRPWNLVGGHLVSAFIGVSCYKFIPGDLWAASLSVPLSMLGMVLLRCMHPPGGATAITAVIGGASVHQLGYEFLVLPVMFNSIVLLSIAMAIGSLRTRNPFYVDFEDKKNGLDNQPVQTAETR